MDAVRCKLLPKFGLIYPTSRVLNDLNLVNSKHVPSHSTAERWSSSHSRRDSVLGEFPTNCVISTLIEFVYNFRRSSASCSLSSRKDKSTSIGQSLLQILSSNRSNDEISAELAELLGFDELELVAEIVADRVELYAKVLHRT